MKIELIRKKQALGLLPHYSVLVDGKLIVRDTVDSLETVLVEIFSTRQAGPGLSITNVILTPAEYEEYLARC